MSVIFLVVVVGGLVLLGVVGAMIVVVVQNRRMGEPVQYQPEPPRPAPAPLTGDLEFDVRELVARGNKIGAIKLVREHTGLGLKEAKDYVDALEAGRAPAPPPTLEGRPKPAPLDMAEVDAEARALVARGNKIGAIKLVREHTGLGLKEAMEYVEGLETL